MKIKKTFLCVLVSFMLSGCGEISYEEIKNKTEANAKIQEAVNKSIESSAKLKKMHVKTKINAQKVEDNKEISLNYEQEIGMDLDEKEYFLKLKSNSAYYQCVSKIDPNLQTSYSKGEATYKDKKYSVAFKCKNTLNQDDMSYASIIKQCGADVYLEKIKIDLETTKLLYANDGSLEIVHEEIIENEDESNTNSKTKTEIIVNSNGLLEHVSKMKTEGNNRYTLTTEFNYDKSCIPSIVEDDYVEKTDQDKISTIIIISVITNGF